MEYCNHYIFLYVNSILCHLRSTYILLSLLVFQLLLFFLVSVWLWYYHAHQNDYRQKIIILELSSGYRYIIPIAWDYVSLQIHISSRMALLFHYRYRLSTCQNFWKSEPIFPKIRTSECSEVRISENPDFRNCENAELRTIRKSGVSKFR